MRLQALTCPEIYKFHRELVRRLDDDIDQTGLTENDIRNIAMADDELSRHVETLTDGNEDLAANLFRATAMFIEQQDYNGLEDHPTFAERPDNLIKKVSQD